ncbi:MAG TPA: transglycosylase SLT domain-containing protein [Alphaproteobacteria bacterium]|nr:transglycosylase SLT domain-containing protein [Alphaproteobacteria bacterium]
MSRRHRLCRQQILAECRGSHRASPLWLIWLAALMAFSAWSMPQAWGQEITGGMKLLLQELREVKKAHAEALAQVEDLRRQVRVLSAGGLTSVHYRLPPQIDFAGQPVPLGRRDVWERLDQEFLLYIGRPGQVMLWIKRMGKYMPLIEERLRAYGLPADLKYLAVVESSLRPTATSSAGAAGLWQFIETTGQRFDMDSNPFVDERMDVIRATDGAMQYLQRLYDLFNDWPLALAGYNAGEQRVLNELREQGVSSYYDLALPTETERFVYKIIAVKVILSDPARYGIVIDEQEYYHPPEVETVTVRVNGNRLHLRTVAEAAGTHYAMIKYLNPQLRQRYLPRGVHQVYVPRGSGVLFAQNFQEPYDPEPAVVSQPVVSQPVRYQPSPRRQSPPVRKTIRYEVKRGDTLAKIAAKFDASVAELAKWNNLASTSHITPGRQLVILRD